MRAAPLLLTPVLLALALAPGAGSVGGVVVLAVGEADHHYENHTGDPRYPSCDARGPIAVHYLPALREALVVSLDAPACTPGFSRVTSCRGTEATDIACERDGNGNRIALILARDGAFRFSWVAPTFVETIEGQLTRA